MMAATEGPTRAHERGSRRRPFSSWVKRLASLKNSSFDSHSNSASTKRNTIHGGSKSKKSTAVANNPYPASGVLPGGQANGHLSFSSPSSRRTASVYSGEAAALEDSQKPPRSAAPTLSTNPETTKSSKAGSSGGRTGATAGGGGGSTFSSPAPSVRSLTTSLTTIQSTAPSTMLANGINSNVTTAQQTHHNSHNPNSPSHFTHQFPTSPIPSAIPPHLAPHTGGGHPSTYTTATANNLLTDNASILTLASSSKRRRRHSFDTDASVRALAPSSLWGGSRESLPLSVLSGNVDAMPAGAASIIQRQSVVPATSGTERASVYSQSGIAPALGSERNSYYGGRAGDGGSIKSGYLGHGRSDSIGGMAIPGSPLASPREVGSISGGAPGRMSRRSSGWGDVGDELRDDEPGNKDDMADKEKEKEEKQAMLNKG